MTDEKLPISDALQRPLRDLRISVTDRCNFRCPYCMPREVFGHEYRFLPRREILNFDEIARVVNLSAALGVTKVRLSGGEPLLRTQLDSLVASVRSVPGITDIALTTNGVLLPRHAKSLAAAGLDRVTVSLDSLDEEVFAAMGGHPGATVADVLEGIAAAEQAGLGPVKINCVVERGRNEHTVLDLARHFRGTGQVLRFIEFMDVGTLNQWHGDKVVSAGELREIIHQEFPLESVAPAYPGEVARRFRYIDGQGEIGFIASVTQPFCGGCTRARLTTEGKLVTCLFATDGTDLREPLRSGWSDEELSALLRSVWETRNDRYSQQRGEEETDRDASRIEMYRMGG